MKKTVNLFLIVSIFFLSACTTKQAIIQNERKLFFEIEVSKNDKIISKPQFICKFLKNNPFEYTFKLEGNETVKYKFIFSENEKALLTISLYRDGEYLTSSNIEVILNENKLNTAQILEYKFTLMHSFK